MLIKLTHKYLKCYHGFPLAIWLTVFTVFIASSGFVLNNFFTLFLINAKHIAISRAGIIIGIGGAGAMLGSYVSGILCNRFHPSGIIRLSLLGFVSAMLMFTVVKLFVVLCIINFYSNFCLGIFRPANFMLLFAHCEKSEHTRVMGFYRVAFNMGLSVGAVMGGLLASINFTYLFLFAAFLGLTATVLLFKFNSILTTDNTATQVKANNRSHNTEVHASYLIDVFRNKPFMLLATLFLLHCFIFYQLRSSYGLYLNHVYNISLRNIGLFMLINFVTIIFLEVPIMTWLKKYNLVVLVTYGNLLVGLSVVILPFVLPLGYGHYFIALSVLLWTMGEILATSPFFTLAVRFANPHITSFYVGIFQSISSISLILVPVIGTYLYTFMNGKALWIGCGVLSFLMTFGFLILNKASKQWALS